MRKILIIEDNEDNLYLIRYILQHHGYRTIEARDGNTGVRQAIEGKPDMIILDIQLPDINGLEATRMIRSSVVKDTIPIIALTSYAMPGDSAKAFSAGCNGYIEKPINPEMIMTEIEKYFR